MSRCDRISLIQEIQNIRQSKVICYLTGDRVGAPGIQINSEMLRPLYEHIRDWGYNGVEKIDLYLYSRGGAVDVPWPLITMLREYCKELNVLIPFRAHSAATLIALGADSIVMGKKGELGPIDPIFSRRMNDQDEVIPVEDVMSYVGFLKERVGLGDQTALANMAHILADKLTPWTLGSMYRTNSHIRNIARKMLASHNEPLDEQKTNAIIETLAEKTYFHGHAIGRKEAEGIGLKIVRAPEQIDNLMWRLFECYEQLLKLNQPIDPRIILSNNDREEIVDDIVLAVIETEARTNLFGGKFKIQKFRQMPNQFNMPLNIGLPAGITPNILPEQLREMLQGFIQEIQAQLPGLVRSEIQKQAPIAKIQGDLLEAAWRDTTAAGD